MGELGKRETRSFESLAARDIGQTENPSRGALLIMSDENKSKLRRNE